MNIRKPAVAGQFYESNPQRLQQEVKAYVEGAQVEAEPDRVAAIMAPHAGYIYSGPTAGAAFARVRGKKPKRVILLGCSHRYGIGQASVYAAGGFETPLGLFPVDEPFASALSRDIGSVPDTPHINEHSLEVQLPFVWVAMGETPIVPVLFGGPARAWHVSAGRTIAKMADESDLVVASTDLSHYRSDAEAHQIDKRTLDAVLAQDCEALAKALDDETCSMCGGSAVVAAMAFALERGATAWTVLDYRTSAAASGDYNRVVGYGAMSMERLT